MKPWLKKSFVRTPQKRQKSFCIFTEGRTEKLYFNDFGLATIEVRCLDGGGALHLVSEAIAYMKQSKYSGYDYYWLVFDRDENSSDEIQQAIRKAEKNRISWCFSNPCFEIWYLLHFSFYQSSTTPKELKTRLVPRHIPGYEETMPGIFDLLKEEQTTAIRNSQRLWPSAERTSRLQQMADLNPATNVDELVCKLNACRK